VGATTRSLGHPAREAREEAQSGSGWYAVLARTGLVAKGISFALVGALALKLALGDGGKATSRQGALASIAQHGPGKIALALLALGFAAYALWRFVAAYAEREDKDTKKWAKRIAYIGSGVVYSALTFSTLKLLVGSGGHESQNESAHKTTGTVLDWPAGRWLVGAAGVCIVAAGLWNGYRGLARKFEEKWRGGLGATARRWGARIGVAGHLARAVVFALIGWFVIKAAVEFDPRDAIGLDGALQKLAHASYGPLLLGVTAAGVVAYGVFCFVDARLRDVSA
jgi:hypothetical protein